MRKKIPTITRPDPAYAAALRSEGEEDPEREDGRMLAGRGPVMARPVQPTVPMPQEPVATPSLSMPAALVSTEAAMLQAERPSAPVRRLATTRKIDIRVNALERQEEALIDCGVDPAHVIRAALRRAVKNWTLEPDFVAPSEEQRTRITEWRARTSLAVDAPTLAQLLRAQDPLDVLSKWTLIRGQVEPRVWAEIDTILHEIAANAAVPREGGDH
ncbi:MAG: hypothetical protein U1E06_05795 [Tabrizicola sp.]|nr:hypothetical protein [Tabrizicola sp.]